MKYCLIIFCLLFTLQVSSQSDLGFEFSYDVQQVYEPLSLSRVQAEEAETVLDLNKYYKPSWVKEFISVEVKSTVDGELKSATSTNDELSPEQKAIINTADIGAEVVVKLDYIPQNNLSHNDPKVFDFKFRVNPEQTARYKAGEEDLMKYLEKNAFDKIAMTTFKQYNLSAVKFTIDEHGQVTNAHVVESSKDEEVDKVLLEAVCSMPDWVPAAYADGTRTKQEFVLTAGDKTSCVVNLLNIRGE